jgi:hypothetical protein
MMGFPLEPGLIREGSYSAHARGWDRRQIGESREGRFRFSLDGSYRWILDESPKAEMGLSLGLCMSLNRPAKGYYTPGKRLLYTRQKVT